ncbi:hypothetical protein CBR_g18933 [Chara braunii]|uniref:PHD-type domain-containing protein n=1 Tax=Chara braunii TaxID=69332 RepID=A0A388KX38_CHABU|nr:hypothetical protein CBR_g18933 [Chara braunii]|eukprot:GBG74523.1 hypothetical protein CBR_g18933 [Chara braunii]
MVTCCTCLHKVHVDCENISREIFVELRSNPSLSYSCYSCQTCRPRTRAAGGYKRRKISVSHLQGPCIVKGIDYCAAAEVNPERMPPQPGEEAPVTGPLGVPDLKEPSAAIENGKNLDAGNAVDGLAVTKRVSCDDEQSKRKDWRTALPEKGARPREFVLALESRPFPLDSTVVVGGDAGVSTCRSFGKTLDAQEHSDGKKGKNIGLGLKVRKLISIGQAAGEKDTWAEESLGAKLVGKCRSSYSRSSQGGGFEERCEQEEDSVSQELNCTFADEVAARRKPVAKAKRSRLASGIEGAGFRRRDEAGLRTKMGTERAKMCVDLQAEGRGSANAQGKPAHAGNTSYDGGEDLRRQQIAWPVKPENGKGAGVGSSPLITLECCNGNLELEGHLGENPKPKECGVEVMREAHQEVGGDVGGLVSIGEATYQEQKHASRQQTQHKILSFSDERLCYFEACIVCGGLGMLAEGTYLCCIDCGEAYHSFCLEPPLVVNSKMRSFWRCPKCKLCEICGLATGGMEGLQVCSSCDRSFHSHCAPQPGCQWYAILTEEDV